MHFRFRGAVMAALVAALALPTSLVQGQQQPATPPASADRAGTDQPVVVVSVSSLDRLVRNVNYVTTAAGAVQAGGIFSVMVQTFSEGVDRGRPLGLVVPMVDGAPAPMLMVPIRDLRAFLQRLEAQLGEPDELDDGTLVVAVGANLIYIRELDGWAYAAQDASYLDHAPSDPMDILGDVSERYDLAIRLNVQAVPAEMRQLLVAQLEQGFRQGLQQQEQSDEDRQMAEQIGQQGIDQLKQMINETDMLQIGLGVDPQEGQVFMEVESQATPDSQLAQQMAEQEPIPTRFGGFIQPDAAAYAHGATAIGPAGQAQAKQSIQQARMALEQALRSQEEEGKLDAESRQLLQTTLNEALALLSETVEEGVSNGGAVLRLDDNQLRFLLGFHVSDGEKAEAMVRRLAEAAEGEPNAPQFRFDADQHEGVTLHTAEAPIPEDKDEARKIFGPTLPLVIGTGEKSVYVGFGQGANDLLKEVVDRSATPPSEEQPLSIVEVSLLPIVEFAQWVESSPTLDTVVATLRQYEEKDEVVVVSRGIERGQQVRITVEEGLLRAIGAASQAGREQPQF